jgi:hypothetical protein
MKTVAGIFDSQADAEAAINELSRIGLEEDSIHLVNGTGTAGGGSILSPLADALTPGDDHVSSMLTRYGLSAEEAEFYSEEIDPEGVILVVDAPEEHHAEVLGAMRRANGRIRDAG